MSGSSFFHPLAAALAEADAVPDAELLRRFAADGDAVAFELLVRRHAEMVWAVCRSALPSDHHAAEDAFQATFAVLARKAGSVRHASAAGWLFRVARNAAGRARRRAVRPLPDDLPAATSADPIATAEVARVVAEEVERLADHFRHPVLLCFYQGQTHAQAAEQLGWAVGTVASRLARAKGRLKERLMRRGVVLPASGAGVLLGVVPAAVRAACQHTGNPTDAVRSLTTEVLRSMTNQKLMRAVLAAAVVLAGVGALSAWAAGRDDPKAEVKGAKPEPDKKKLAAELAKFQGTWKVTKLADGKRGEAAADELKGMSWVVAGTAITARNRPGEKGQVGSFALDPTQTPTHIDVTMGGPNGDQVLPGVYEFVGGKLRIVVAEAGAKRPTEIAAGTENGLIELELDDGEKKPAEPKEPDAKAIAAELEKFQGEWAVADGDRGDGQGWPSLAGFKISGREVTVRRAGKGKDEKPDTLLLGFDPTGPFKKVNLTAVTGRPEFQGMMLPGIYSFEGDKLTLCLGDVSLSDANRPTAFKGGGKPHGVLLVLTKKK